MTLDAIIDQAHLLKPGDVVAVSPRGAVTVEAWVNLRGQLKELNDRIEGVEFVLFGDCDLTVLRPVEADE